MTIWSSDSDSATSKCNNGLQNEAFSQNLEISSFFSKIPGSGNFLLRRKIFGFSEKNALRQKWCEALSAVGPKWCEALSAFGQKCKKSPAKISNKNLSRCAYAYGSHKHRWVRSTLRNSKISDATKKKTLKPEISAAAENSRYREFFENLEIFQIS